jgi:hypothetical protein
MALIRPARFSWVTELVLTRRRRGRLWLSAVNFSATQSHRAFHIDLWLATGPSSGYWSQLGSRLKYFSHRGESGFRGGENDGGGVAK